MKSMYTLALETSCDETSAAVIEDGRHIRSNIISTQVPIHRKFGGVVPEIASRQHIEYVMPCLLYTSGSRGDHPPRRNTDMDR